MVHGDRSVDVFVRKLRQKLEKVSPGWRYIHTHFGIGYRFAAEPVEAVASVEAEALTAAAAAAAAAAAPEAPVAEPERASVGG
jgi:DNA-binding winged helix-turn-helix (wHTH) protein